MKYYIDVLIENRLEYRLSKQYKAADDMRDLLEKELIFCIDHKDYQEVHYLTEKYFARKPESMTNRQYFEHRLRQDRKAEATLNAWIYSHIGQARNFI